MASNVVVAIQRPYTGTRVTLATAGACAISIARVLALAGERARERAVSRTSRWTHPGTVFRW